MRVVKTHMPRSLAATTAAICLAVALTATAQENTSELQALKEEITRQRTSIELQRAEVERQAEELEQRLRNLDALEQRLEAALSGSSQDQDALQTAPLGEAEEPASPQAVASTGPDFISDEPTLILTGDDLVDAEFPGSWPIFGTTTRMRIGGYIKADAIFDFDGHGDPAGARRHS